MKRWTKALGNISMLTQLGLSLIMPMLLCIALCYYLTTHWNIPGWIYIPGIFFGLGGSFASAYKFYRLVMKNEQKNERADSMSFNTHK